jgi:flagellar hook-length control protein FliK
MAKGGKRTHVTPQQPIDGDASTPAAPTQLGAAPAPTAAPAAPSAPSLPPVAAPAPGYAGRFIDPQPEQSGALARLRSHGDGSHELTVSLHPAELGAVNVSATLHGDQLTVTVACSSDAARAAVTAALPTLHQQLAGAGFGGVDVQFGGPSQDPGHAGQQQAPGQDQPSGRHRAPEQTTTAPERRRPAQDAALDRLL